MTERFKDLAQNIKFNAHINYYRCLANVFEINYVILFLEHRGRPNKELTLKQEMRGEPSRPTNP
jgi:hypothetical protein